jgi:LytS/YehU family sensor histidine kinase
MSAKSGLQSEYALTIFCFLIICYNISFNFVLFQSAMFGEMLGSGRATPKLLGLYVLFLVFAIASVARGLCSCSSTQATPAAGPSSPALAAWKKRV